MWGRYSCTHLYTQERLYFVLCPPVMCIIYVITFLFVLTTTRSMILLGKVNSSTLLTHCLCILMHIHTVYKRFTFLYVFFLVFIEALLILYHWLAMRFYLLVFKRVNTFHKNIFTNTVIPGGTISSLSVSTTYID